MPPFRFGTKRSEIFQLLGKPTSWASLDEGIGPPVRGYESSDSISYGSLTFSLKNDSVVGISVAADVMRDLAWTYPVEVISFPQHTTTIAEIADYMRRLEIPFEDLTENQDDSMLKTAAGVTLVMSFRPRSEGRLMFCYIDSEKRRVPNKPLETTR